MSRLLDIGELERHALHVRAEADRLLTRAAAELAELARFEAVETTDRIMVRRSIAESRVSAIGRQFTRAQAVLVHPDDERDAAARAVIGYCDDADRRSPWAIPLPHVELGSEAVIG